MSLNMSINYIVKVPNLINFTKICLKNNTHLLENTRIMDF